MAINICKFEELLNHLTKKQLFFIHKFIFMLAKKHGNLMSWKFLVLMYWMIPFIGTVQRRWKEKLFTILTFNCLVCF